MICTISLMFTGVFYLQFQVDLMHNIYIHSDRKDVHILLLNMFSERDLYYLRDLFILLT